MYAFSLYVTRRQRPPSLPIHFTGGKDRRRYLFTSPAAKTAGVTCSLHRRQRPPALPFTSPAAKTASVTRSLHRRQRPPALPFTSTAGTGPPALPTRHANLGKLKH